MKLSNLQLLAAGVLTLIAGCTNPGIVKLSPDTYLLSREDHAGIFGSAKSMKADVIREASEFAESMGKVAVPISEKEKPMGSGPAQWASFDYQFRVVDKNDPEVRRKALNMSPNVLLIQHDEADDAIARNKPAKAKSRYSQLLELDELRKKGIITQDEFNTEKEKILSEN